MDGPLLPGNPSLAREKILSILHHITGEYLMLILMLTDVLFSGSHTFPTFSQFKECAHGELEADRNKPWIKPGRGAEVFGTDAVRCKMMLTMS
jgi:hypothetical protein